MRIERHPGAPSREALDRIENLLVFVPEKQIRGDWSGLPYADVLKRRITRAGTDSLGETPLVTDLPNAAGTRVTVTTLPGDPSAFALLELARAHVQRHVDHRARHLALVAPGMGPPLIDRVAEAVAAAALAATAELPDFRSRARKPAAVTRLRLFGIDRGTDLARTRAGAEGNNLARALTLLPPNELTPGAYRRRIAALARTHGWTMRFFDTATLRRRRAGAFLAVVQGSATDDGGIVELRYRPPRPSRSPALALVGKGVCYDTGGVNVKPARHMLGMHEDMEGSAVALGTLLALTRLRVPFPVRCWLALAQNHVGPRAYKPGDVVRAADGTTIEVVHTDAEGRMVLADTLVLARRDKPGLIIDYATLTGSCVHALGTGYSGAVTNRDELREDIVAAGRASGERVWPFPFDPDYDKALESRIADVRQCAVEGEADHILGGRFLARFVGDTPWIHIDLSAGNHKGGLAHIPTDVTGFGIRFTLDLLLDRKVLKA